MESSEMLTCCDGPSFRIISMLISLNMSIPRYLSRRTPGAPSWEYFGHRFSLTAGSLVVSAFGQPSSSWARACAAVDRAKLRGYVAMAAALGGAFGGLAYWGILLDEVSSPSLRPEYGERPDICPLDDRRTIMFIASGLGYVITAAGSLRPQIPVLLAAAIAAAATSAWSIPKYGLSGAADAARPPHWSS